jgi:antitoxin MazE
MNIELVRIGNSRGIRIPKAILQQCGFRTAVELHVQNDQLVITPAHPARQGWEEQFKAAGPSNHDELLLGAADANEFDRKDWRW